MNSQRYFSIDVSRALPIGSDDVEATCVEYRPCVCSQPIKLYVEQERAERKLQERAIKEATARYAGTVPMSEDQPPSKELRRIQRAAAQRASVEFHRFNSPRFCREYKRDVQMLICITMYNEHADELERTLKGVAENIEQMGFGLTWRDIAVIIIVDGYSKMNPSMEDYMQKKLNIFVPEIMLPKFRGRDVTCHWFERTVSLTKHKTMSEYFLPMQIVFCVKARNGGKLNSHLWFFRGFCELIQPHYTFLLDVGTVPQTKALRRCYRAFEENNQVAGVCGEISVRQHRVYSMVVSAQVFEYKMSHVLDKAMESVFGYITVLPGAFSAYRWIAIENAPLHEYFKTEEQSMEKISAFEANMFLAEDRILCLEILAKEGRDWTMHYVAGAVAETDVPEDLISLIKQRRRWLNGAFFALMYLLLRFTGVLFKASHSWLRKLVFCFQFAYLLVLVVLNWLSPGSLYLSFYVIFAQTTKEMDGGSAALFIFSLTYIFSFFIVVLAAVGNDIAAVGRLYSFVSYVYGIMGILATALGAWHTLGGSFDLTVQIVSMSSILCYVISALIHGEIVLITVVMLQYIFMLPTLVNVLPIYSFCNLHDISWGTKEGNLRAEIAREADQQQALAKNQALIAAKKKKPDDASSVGTMDENTALANKAAAQALASQEVYTKVGQAGKDTSQTRAQDLLKEELKHVQMSFRLFRLRLLSLWLACNFTFVLFIMNFNLLNWFLLVMLCLILLTLIYRTVGSILYQLLRVMKVLWRRCPGCCCCFGCCLTRRRNYQCSPTIIPTQMRASMFRPDFKLNKDRGLERVQTADESKAGRFSSIDELGDWSDAGSEYDNFSGAASSADGAVDLTRDLANAADTAAYVTRQESDTMDLGADLADATAVATSVEHHDSMRRIPAGANGNAPLATVPEAGVPSHEGVVGASPTPQEGGDEFGGTNIGHTDFRIIERAGTSLDISSGDEDESPTSRRFNRGISSSSAGQGLDVSPGEPSMTFQIDMGDSDSPAVAASQSSAAAAPPGAGVMRARDVSASSVGASDAQSIRSADSVGSRSHQRNQSASGLTYATSDAGSAQQSPRGDASAVTGDMDMADLLSGVTVDVLPEPSSGFSVTSSERSGAAARLDGLGGSALSEIDEGSENSDSDGDAKVDGHTADGSMMDVGELLSDDGDGGDNGNGSGDGHAHGDSPNPGPGDSMMDMSDLLSDVGSLRHIGGST